SIFLAGFHVEFSFRLQRRILVSQNGLSTRGSLRNDQRLADYDNLVLPISGYGYVISKRLSQPRTFAFNAKSGGHLLPSSQEPCKGKFLTAVDDLLLGFSSGKKPFDQRPHGIDCAIKRWHAFSSEKIRSRFTGCLCIALNARGIEKHIERFSGC